jgi:hypothetical protein
MLNLSNEVFKALVKYLKGESVIADLREYMVGLRIEKYKVLADADRLFLDEFEGRYAEFSEFGEDEALLKASLANYVRADEPATSAQFSNSWSLQSSNSTGSQSISVGVSSPTGNLAAAVGVCR